MSESPRAPVLLVLSLVVLAARIPAQGQHGVAPPLEPLERIGRIELPPYDLETLMSEDVAREARGLPPRYAVPHERRLTPHDSGTWENLDAATLLWRLLVLSPGARSLNLGFGQYRMTAGGRLHVYSSDRTHVVRPFTRADNESHGELWTPVVLTDALVIELVI